jgi:hypothetical protein
VIQLGGSYKTYLNLQNLTLTLHWKAVECVSLPPGRQANLYQAGFEMFYGEQAIITSGDLWHKLGK